MTEGLVYRIDQLQAAAPLHLHMFSAAQATSHSKNSPFEVREVLARC
jgi:2-iminoacetate synthase ThiH